MGAFKKSWRYMILTKLGQHVDENDGSCCVKFQNS